MTTQNPSSLNLSELMAYLDDKPHQQAIPPEQLLQRCMEILLQRQLEHSKDKPITDLYQRVSREVEVPLFKTVLRYTKFNQVRAAACLGISRTTFQKRLKQYQLDVWLAKEKHLPLA